MHELIDPRLVDSYDTFELYHMAKTAYLCVKSEPEKRPSMGEVNTSSLFNIYGLSMFF